MRSFRFPTTPRQALAWLAIALGVAASPPAAAQYIGGPPPPLPAPPRAGQVESPAATLARAVRMLAQSPRNFPALINAGNAALDLGDTQAAIGFFGRAEEVRPSDPSPKIGLGAATVADGDAGGALRWFFQAQQLGATPAAMGADRGLAQDLLGNQAAAQADYRAALAGSDATEARRRLALSLGISGDRTGAFTILQPLLQRQDPAAQRIRAFVLALVGDERGASSAIDVAMPGSGGRMAGFFRLLPSLTAPQKAAAVHLGVFPDPSQIRVAAVSPRLLAPAVPERRPAPTRSPPPPPVSRPVTTSVPATTPSFAPRLALPATNQPTAIAVPTPPITAPVAPPEPAVAATPPVAAPAQPGFTATAAVPEAVKFDLPSARAAPSSTPLPAATPGTTGDRLSGIDRLLAQADELPVPPAPRPRYETAAPTASPDSAKADKAAERQKTADAKKANAKKLADARKLAETRKLADAKKAAEAKKLADEKREREAIGLAGTHWVQLAGGANADRMGTEFRRLGAKSSALRGKGGAVTAGKDYFRLLTGPFATKAAAQSFVNQLAKDGVDGFSWTRTPAGIRIEKIAPR